MLHDERFSISQERGFGEWFQYAQTTTATALLVLLAVRARALVLLTWAAIMAYVALDDSLQLHERAGVTVGGWLGVTEAVGLAAEELGQLIYQGSLGLVVVPLLVYSHFRATGPARKISVGLFLLGAAFVGCSIVADNLGLLLGVQPLNLLEDGGELLVMSVTVWFLWLWLEALRASPDT
jgi:hypothetical protein